MGFEMVYSGLINSLTNEGMKVIETKVGDKLNTKYHMAIDLIEDDTKEENTILEIKQKGYVLHDRLIRPTTVVVSKKKETKKKDKKESK
jgi:molecular chaperone GrpE